MSYWCEQSGYLMILHNNLDLHTMVLNYMFTKKYERVSTHMLQLKTQHLMKYMYKIWYVCYVFKPCIKRKMFHQLDLYGTVLNHTFNEKHVTAFNCMLQFQIVNLMENSWQLCYICYSFKLYFWPKTCNAV